MRPLDVVTDGYLASPLAVVAGGLLGGSAAVTASGGVAAGTSWNADWATKYGPLRGQKKPRLTKTERKEVKAAIEEFAQTERMPLQFVEAQEMAKRSLAADLFIDENTLDKIRQAKVEHKMWRRRQNKIAALLLLN